MRHSSAMYAYRASTCVCMFRLERWGMRACDRHTPAGPKRVSHTLHRCAASQRWTSYPAGLLAARRAAGPANTSLAFAKYLFSANGSVLGTAASAGLSAAETHLLTAIRSSCGRVLVAPQAGTIDALLQFNGDAMQSLRPPSSNESAQLAVPGLQVPAYRSPEHLVYFQRQARLDVLGGVAGGWGCPPGQVRVAH